MAAFIAKQMMGNQLSAVKEISVGDNLSAEEKERLAQLETERLEALREQEERRTEKHKKMEEEREKIRKGIRDKYNIKKREDQDISMDQGFGGDRQDSINSQIGRNPLDPQADENEDEFTKIGGGDAPSPEEKEKMEQLERERLEALREAEERRMEKHRKMEEERETMRQGIREKYGIKKREEKEAELKKKQQEMMGDIDPASGLNRKKKTPEEISAEQAEANQDEFTKLKNSIETQVSDIKGQIEEKCSIQ